MRVTGIHLDIGDEAHILSNVCIMFAHFFQKSFQITRVSVVPPSSDTRYVLKRVK